jgi:hypothetical protein
MFLIFMLLKKIFDFLCVRFYRSFHSIFLIAANGRTHAAAAIFDFVSSLWRRLA